VKLTGQVQDFARLLVSRNSESDANNMNSGAKLLPYQQYVSFELIRKIPTVELLKLDKITHTRGQICLERVNWVCSLASKQNSDV